MLNIDFASMALLRDTSISLTPLPGRGGKHISTLFPFLPAVVGGRRTCIYHLESEYGEAASRVTAPQCPVGVMPSEQGVCLRCQKLVFLLGKAIFLQTTVFSGVSSKWKMLRFLRRKGLSCWTPQKKGSVPFQLTVAPGHLVLIAISTDGRLFPGLLGPSSQ